MDIARELILTLICTVAALLLLAGACVVASVIVGAVAALRELSGR